MYKKIVFFLLIMIFSIFNGSVSAKYEKLAYDFSFNGIDGNILKLSEFKGKVIIVINVASKCGFTKQYDDIQKVWETYQKKGLVIIGVPSNDFGNQEPGTSKEIKSFCETNFNITFPLAEKTIVKGDKAHPFYTWAKQNHGKSAIPIWNFHKIIIDKSGKVHKTFTPITNPSSKKFLKVLDQLINI